MSGTKTPEAPATPTGPPAGEGPPEQPIGRRLVAQLRNRLLRLGRPGLYTAYGQDTAWANTGPKRLGVLALLAAGVLAIFFITDDLLLVLALGYAAAIGAIGLNLVTGYAGQISIGHAFFLGLGAYTAAVLGGPVDGRYPGFGLPMEIWVPAAGVVAAIPGALVAPIATRLRGLYLAIVTLGLVFLGEHIFREARGITGGFNVGRSAPPLELFGYRFDTMAEPFGIALTRVQNQYLLALIFLVLFAVIGRNIARSKVGRAFGAIRDRDIAAAVIGINLTRYKVIAFTISSFFAGVGGALFYGIVGHIEPSSFDLLLSIQYVAMVFIGGVATIAGSIMGATFVIGLHRISAELAHLVPFVGTGGWLTVPQLEAILYGLLIVVFLLVEPRGLYGIWTRIRNYFKSWPFSY